MLLALMLVGGMAGSTAGGVKVVRCMLVLKHGWLQISRLIHPREVRLLKLDGQVVESDVIRSVLDFVVLFAALLMAGFFAMAACGLDLVTAGTSVLTCLSNVGSGLGGVGPTDNYAFIPTVGKIILSLMMLLGRLEIFRVLVLVLPSSWRR